MSTAKRILRRSVVLLSVLACVWACGFDDTLREYLSARFWLPFAKQPGSFERPQVKRISAAFAGMTADQGKKPLAKLRAAYQAVVRPKAGSADAMPLQQALIAAQADLSLTDREKEEVSLIDAKTDLRTAEPDKDLKFLQSAEKKLKAFLLTARTPEFRSEARGWLARVYYLSGDQTAAGKIYLDELNQSGSNLSRETLLESLEMNYGYDGGSQLRAHLEEYFDTPEHAAFAIQLVTNPHWDRYERQPGNDEPAPESGTLVRDLLTKHRQLLRSNTGANTLALLTMRTALHVGDPAAARALASEVPANAAIRSDPDFNWMEASAMFLSEEYAAAERPLLALFRSGQASDDQKAAAAYGLCGVYWKTGNVNEQLRFALWLYTAARKQGIELSEQSGIRDLSVYWSSSGWDLYLLLDVLAPVDALRAFAAKNPNLSDIRLVKYSLAVRLAREDCYEEAAEIFESIRVQRRASRMRQMTTLYAAANQPGLPDQEALEARFKLAEYIGQNQERLYFNAALWHGLQNYAFQSNTESRLTRAERQALIDSERKLRDDQEERWRAYLLLREVARDSGHTALGRKAALLALDDLRRISERFDREEEILKASRDLRRWLRGS